MVGVKTEYQINIIGKIRKLREQHGYSQAQLAAVLDISNGQMGNIESVKTPHKYTLSQIHTISKLFGEPIEEIFEISVSADNVTEIVNKLISNIVMYEK